MPKQSGKKSGGAKKYGRGLVKCQMYRAAHTRERNKIRRVLQSNGREAAEKYARLHGIRMPVVTTVLPPRPVILPVGVRADGGVS